jgi:hypothetical protein
VYPFVRQFLLAYKVEGCVFDFRGIGCFGFGETMSMFICGALFYVLLLVDRRDGL